MIFILEGIDKCGKTTLANKLKKEFGFKIVKCSQPVGAPYVEYMKKLDNLKGDVVFDRFCYGELVYGPIYRGKSALTAEQVRNIELKLMSLNTCIIYCHDEIRRIKVRFVKDGETFAKIEKIAEMAALYQEVMLNSRVPVVQHRMEGKTDLTIGNSLKKLVDVLKTTEPHIKIASAIGNCFSPTFIIVGSDTSKKNAYQSVKQLFDFGNGSASLFKGIEDVTTLDQVMLIDQTSTRLKYIAKTFPGSVFVSLGKVAHSTLKKLNIDHVESMSVMSLGGMKNGSSKISAIIRKVYET